MNRRFAHPLALLLAFSLSACSDDDDNSVMAPGPTMDIVETAISAGSFNTLVAAVEAAGLAATLKGEGPFTVFAPTDAAFEKLPAGTVEDLLKPENVDQLVQILTYHVVAGDVRAADVAGLTSAATVEGSTVDFSTANGVVMVDGAVITQADILTTNGVIHVIDTVILP